MTTGHFHRACLYLALTFAALVLVGEHPEEEFVPFMSPAIVAIGSILAWTVVDRPGGRGLPAALANPLGLLAVGLAYLEYESNRVNNLIPALGHLLIYLQVIKVLQPKKKGDDWYLLTLSLVVVLVGSYIGQGDFFAVLLLGWIMTSLLALMLGHLEHEAQRAGLTEGQVHEGPGPDPYRGLFDGGFLATASLVVLWTLGFGLATFLATPRLGGGTTTPLAGASPMSGFSEEVQLGRMGEVLENDAVVMTIESFDSAGNRVQPDEETHWRGISLVNYRDGKWSRESPAGRPIAASGVGSEARTRGTHVVRHRIKLEPSRTQPIFAPRPVLRAKVTGTGNDPRFSTQDATLSRGPNDGGYYEYEVWTAPGSLFQPDEEVPTEDQPRYGRFLSLPGLTAPGRAPRSQLKERLEGFARRVLAERGNPKAALDRAQALESYLRDGRRYQYTLQLDRVRDGSDPVEDFLFNTKKGHCEYFASALTLLLRASGVPARLVNGFKGGDWNSLSSTTVVRQKHAHSWVEALVQDDDGQARWLEFDPTPPDERRLSVSQVGRSTFRIRLVSDFLRYIWVYYVVGFNAERQRRVLYEPVMQVIRKAGDGYKVLIEEVDRLINWLFDFPDYSSLFSFRGFLVTVGLMLLLAGLTWVVRRIAATWRRWRRGGAGDDITLPGAAFYRRTVLLLAEFGLKRASSETPREFGRRAGMFLFSRDVDDLTDLPVDATDEYYGLRFGEEELDPERVGALETRLDALESELRGRKPGHTA